MVILFRYLVVTVPDTKFHNESWALQIPFTGRVLVIGKTWYFDRNKAIEAGTICVRNSCFQLKESEELEVVIETMNGKCELDPLSA